MYAYMHGEEIQAMRQERGRRIRATTSWKLARVFGIDPMEIGTPDPTGEAAPTLRRLMGLER